MEKFKTWEEADEAAKKAVKENPGRIIFIMRKDRYFSVVIGWDGRDKAIREGWRFREA